MHSPSLRNGIAAMKLDALPPPLITLDTDGVTMQLMVFFYSTALFPPLRMSSRVSWAKWDTYRTEGDDIAAFFLLYSSSVSYFLAITQMHIFGHKKLFLSMIL